MKIVSLTLTLIFIGSSSFASPCKLVSGDQNEDPSSATRSQIRTYLADKTFLKSIRFKCIKSNQAAAHQGLAVAAVEEMWIGDQPRTQDLIVTVSDQNRGDVPGAVDAKISINVSRTESGTMKRTVSIRNGKEFSNIDITMLINPSRDYNLQREDNSIPAVATVDGAKSFLSCSVEGGLKNESDFKTEVE